MTYSCQYWWSEWDKRPYYNCILKDDSGKVLLHIPNANNKISEKDFINMWKARQKSGR